jgi:hypothetical protein
MAARTLETHREHNINGSAVSGSGQRIDCHAPAVADLPSNNSYDQSENLLETDLEKYRGNADALFGISVSLQKLGAWQRAEIQRLKSDKTSNLIITPSKSDSRRQTDETHSSRATTMSVDHDETVVVYSASDNELTVRQRRGMKGTVFTSFSSKRS